MKGTTPTHNLALALAAVLIGGGCGEKPDPAAGLVILRVGDHVLTEDAFKRAAASRRLPDEENAKEALLEELAEQMQLLEWAERNGLDQDPDFIADVEKLLVSRAREAIRPQPLPPPTEAELQVAYNEQRQDFTSPDRYRLAMIWIAVPPNASQTKIDEARDLAESILVQSKAEVPAFSKLAAQHSSHRPSRYRGGDIGFTIPESFDPNWGVDAGEAISGLNEPGEMTEVLSHSDGFRIFRLLSHDRGSTRAYGEVRNQIAEQLMRKRRAEAKETMLAETLIEVPVERTGAPLPSLNTPPPSSPKD